MLYIASVILNILTILIVSLGIVIMYKVVNNPERDAIGAHDAFESALKDPATVIRGFYAEKKYGEIGSFTGSMSKMTSSLVE
jgi:hypothetical protein